MEDSYILSPISILTIAILLFIFNFVMIIQDFSFSFPYSFNLLFSNIFILFPLAKNKNLDEFSVAKKIIIPIRTKIITSIEEVKKIIDDSEVLYEHLYDLEDEMFDKNELMDPKIVREAFRLFDENEDGFIDENELKHVLSLLGYEECSKMECRQMIKVFDENKDGKIDFHEFVKLVNKGFS